VRGPVSLRYLGKLRHLNVGWCYHGETMRLYVLDEPVTLTTEDRESIGDARPGPNLDYQPKGDGLRR
jgi:hypothetical protein